jgi:dipeptidyl aminopeptidase/acylaminoacyl peptidase
MLVKHLPIRALLATVACAFLATTVAAQGSAQAPAKPPVDVFFQNPGFVGAVLSPTGRHLALGVSPKNGRRQLMVLDTEKLTAKMVAGFADADIGWFSWASDDRLLMNLVDLNRAVGDIRTGSGLQMVMRDGSKLEEVIFREHNANIVALPRRRASNHVFLVRSSTLRDVNLALVRQDIITREKETYRGAGQVRQWILDQNDEPRLTVGVDEKKLVVNYLEPANGKWRELARFDPLSPTEAFTPMGFGPDGALYVHARLKRDKSAVYKYDLAANRIEPEPLVSLPDYDFSGTLLVDETRLLGVRYLADGTGTIWFDPALKQVQARVDALLPSTSNVVDVPLHAEVPLVLVRSFSDKDPGTYRLFNTETGKLTLVGQALPGIEPSQMAAKDLFRYKARDGLEIPAWLTLPKGGKTKLPMVVFVHDGPWERGSSWHWDDEEQFLASRGYAVLTPEYRGSLGYGFKHFQAGWRQWGLAMQNDIADGVRWAIDKGIADPARICIAGPGYGGYSALMGLLNDPELFRCGIAWASVTGIDLLYSPGWWNEFKPSDTSPWDMERLVAHREKDEAQINKTSPYLHAARIKQPVLLAHGSSDVLVPLAHSAKFKNALQKTNPNVDWVEYEDEGHTWRLVKTRVDFWTRVEKFLEKNIGR